MGVVSKKVTPNNQLVEIIYAVEGEADLNVYKKLAEQVQPTCPQCGAKLEITPDKALLAMSNPLYTQADMDLATPLTYCPRCNARIVFPTICDIHAFQSLTKFIGILRAQARKRGIMCG